MADLPGLAYARKRIIRFPGWSSPEEETGYMGFSAPLAIGNVVEEAFRLEGNCFRQFRNENVTFELVLAKTPLRRRQPLERVDWKSLRGGHSNGRGRPQGIEKKVGRNHIHPFSQNYIEHSRKMRGNNLPFAEDMPDDVRSFDKLLDFVGFRLNIENIAVVQHPDWDYGLFDDPPRFPAGS